MQNNELIVATVVASLVLVSGVSAMSLEEAKSKGLVGEKPNGYLGVVGQSGPDVHALADEVNHKRRQAYEDIAKRNRTQLDSVEALAGQKAIQNTQPGHFVESPGGWVKK